ncbi:MAG TPA: hypothetical protein VFZ83_03930 [Acidimicrobiia bacterium]|nr:hypothetical protein [Acidimicrobiia bacterium]
MKRVVLAAVASVTLVVGLAPAAFAGESKGPSGPGGATGGSTPIDGFWSGDGAASICSFSGLNDIIDEEEPTRTQSYGTFLVLVKKAFGLSTHEAMAALEESPGEACNPTRAPFGNPKK